jgi:hypothetical protein
MERRLLAECTQCQDVGLRLDVLDGGVEAAYRGASDVHLAADRVLDGRVIGIQVRDGVGLTLADEFEVRVDSLRYLFSTRHAPHATRPHPAR